jgi:beta-lactam-binding protein with PASTA domain
MPNLKHLSLRQALVTLQSVGLEVDELSYMQYFARNAVVDQLFNGEPIEPDTEIVKGSAVELVLGKGETLTKVSLPMLIGLTQQEAKASIHYNSLNVGQEYFQESFDPIHSRVYKTDPPVLSKGLLDLGAKVNLWYRSDEFFNFDEYIKQFEIDSLKSDTIVVNRYLIEDE